ncbi:hypothetical protein CC31p219 [Enterobacter phage CC31]|uniref:DUF7320 domain-containing protein n=1 Tax=Enterobacter phage CC31 TaxID=709484 RepID=E5DHV1_9CAUD|nr:hypothetical protein CC31p219 [Enterobacter phage CC31]ADB81715.1 hypothetical protein CC31p219 [Enterobacter phage CC31]
MTSDKTFTRIEFLEKLKEFAQALANKVPGAEVQLRPDRVSNGALITITHNGKDQTALLTLDRHGHVTMTNVLGDII